MKKLKALIIGATGATGRELVKLLLENKNFESYNFCKNKPKNITSKINHP